MKIKIFKGPFWLAILSSVVLTSGAIAANGPSKTGTPIRSEAEAKQLPKGSQVVLACAKCKTSLITEVDQKKSFLAWFAPKTQHECPGCGGKMQYQPYSNPSRGLAFKWYTHTCSICGDNSAACSANAPGHKVKL